MRTTITINDDLFEQADRAAKTLGVSRSRLYQRAIEDYLRRLRDRALTLQANEAVAKYGQPASEALSGYIQRAWSDSLGDDDW